MQRETASSVKGFFEGYRGAFERLDAGAIADHFAYPSHVTSDSDQISLVPVAEKPDWIGTHPAPSGHVPSGRILLGADSQVSDHRAVAWPRPGDRSLGFA